MRFLFFLLFAGFTVSCSDRTAKPLAQEEKRKALTSVNDASLDVPASNEYHRQCMDMDYTIRVFQAADYLKAIGRIPAKSDLPALQKEGVMLMEFSRTGNQSNQHPHFSEAEQIQYFSSDIAADLKVMQNNSQVGISGIQYEPSPDSSMYRTIVFLSDIDIKQDYKISYFDRMFGNGVIKITNSAKS